jgi:hypothetical protein
MVHSEFKLADFGFSKFKREGQEAPLEFIDGGTATWGENAPVFFGKGQPHLTGLGPPELDPARIKKTRTPVTQTIDTWSFGCVLLMTATWIVLGWPGIVQFETLRALAISKLRKQKASDDSISVPTEGDAFHDGKTRLAVVDHWIAYLNNHLRKSDTLTARVLVLVKLHMLREKPEDRISSTKLCEELDNYLILAESDREDMIRKGIISETDDTVLEALLRDAEDANVASNLKKEQASRREACPAFNVNIGTDPGHSLKIPLSARKSNRIGKSEKMDKLPKPKTAHREEVLQEELKRRGVTLPPPPPRRPSTSQFVSPNSTDLSSIQESPVDVQDEIVVNLGQRNSTMTLANSTQNRQLPLSNDAQPSPYLPATVGDLNPNTQLSSPAIQPPKLTLSTSTDTQTLVAMAVVDQLNQSKPDAAQIEKSPKPAVNEPSPFLQKNAASTPLDSPHAAQRDASTEEPRNGKTVPAIITPGEDQLNSRPADATVPAIPGPQIDDNVTPSRNLIPSPTLDPSYDICVVRRELDENVGGFSAIFHSAIGRVKKDKYLQQFVTNRDMVSLSR